MVIQGVDSFFQLTAHITCQIRYLKNLQIIPVPSLCVFSLKPQADKPFPLYSKFLNHRTKRSNKNIIVVLSYKVLGKLITQY